MRISTRLLCLLLPVFLFCSCGNKVDTAEGGARQKTSSLTEKAIEMETAHFPEFEVSVPEGWTERGNLCRLYEGDGLFLLICPGNAILGDEGTLQSLCEQTMAEQLELFFNTEYYAGQVRFDYTEFETDASDRTRVSGTLQNGRTGESLPFRGVYTAYPRGCFVYFQKGSASAEMAGQLREVSYESFRAL